MGAEFFHTGLFWLIIGVMLFVMEMAVPGFVLFFFGVGAWVVAGVTWLYPISIAVQLTIFLIASLATLGIFRKFLKGSFFSGDDVDVVIFEEGEECEVTEAIYPPGKGKVKFSGTFWRATADEPIEAGEIVVVEKRTNLVIHVKKIV